MVESIEWLRVFIFHYPYLEYILILLGTAFGGELILLALGFLVAQNIISIYPLVVFGFLGTLFSDTLWFLLGRTSIIKRMVAHRYADTTILAINKAVDRVSGGNHLIAFIIAKFLVGTRILLMMYVGTKTIKFKDFIRNDMVAIFCWLIVVIPIGLLSGFGFTYLAEILENIYAAIGFILLIIFLAIVLEIWLKNRFAHMNNEV
jgi:membrane protein DedA with SNARE-associated domain